MIRVQCLGEDFDKNKVWNFLQEIAKVLSSILLCIIQFKFLRILKKMTELLWD